MFNPYLIEKVAVEHRQELLREAASSRQLHAAQAAQRNNQPHAPRVVQVFQRLRQLVRPRSAAIHPVLLQGH